MRYIIFSIGILLTIIFFVQAKKADEQKQLLLISNQKLSSDVQLLDKNLTSLNVFQTQQPQTLINTYEDLLNRLYLIANANEATLLTRLKDNAPNKDIKLSAKPSVFSGVNQIDLEITIGNLTNSNRLSSVFLGFSDLENTTPIIIQGYSQEKDYLVFNVSVLGV